MSSLFEEAAPVEVLEARIRHLVMSTGSLARCLACGDAFYLVPHADGSYHVYDTQGRLHDRVCPARGMDAAAARKGMPA